MILPASSTRPNIQPSFTPPSRGGSPRGRSHWRTVAGSSWRRAARATRPRPVLGIDGARRARCNDPSGLGTIPGAGLRYSRGNSRSEVHGPGRSMRDCRKSTRCVTPSPASSSVWPFGSPARPSIRESSDADGRRVRPFVEEDATIPRGTSSRASNERVHLPYHPLQRVHRVGEREFRRQADGATGARRVL